MGNLPLCLRQTSGIGYATHALHWCFIEEVTEAIPLIDARNAPKRLKIHLALKNIEKLCPTNYTTVSNSYKTPSDLFTDKWEIKSQERTTQGEPKSMAMNGVAILSLIDMLEDQNLTHKWHADEGNVAGSLESVQFLLVKFNKHGDAYAYNVFKCHLFTAAEFVQKAKKNFLLWMWMLLKVIVFWVHFLALIKAETFFLKEKSIH